MTPHRVTYESDGHIYRLDGIEVPSVTTVLKRAGLTRWQGELTNEAAMARGREVHRLCAAYELDAVALDDVPEAYRGYLASWIAAKAALGLLTQEVEMIVASASHRFAGRLDWVGVQDTAVTIVDLKSGPPGPEAALQTAAYALAYAEQSGLTSPIQRLACHLQADGDMARVTAYHNWRDEPHFLSALAAVHAQLASSPIT